MLVWYYLVLYMQQQGDSVCLSDIVVRFGLDNKLGCLVNQLLGGEWQCVWLVVVILQIDFLSNFVGQLLLLDELMNSLDVVQQVVLDWLLYELSVVGIVVVMSSYDFNYILCYVGQSWLFCQGEVIVCGEIVEVLNEENLIVVYVILFQCVEVVGYIMFIVLQQYVVILLLY